MRHLFAYLTVAGLMAGWLANLTAIELSPGMASMLLQTPAPQAEFYRTDEAVTQVRVIRPVRLRSEYGTAGGDDTTIRVAEVGEQFDVRQDVEWVEADRYTWIPVVADGQIAWIAQEGFVSLVTEQVNIPVSQEAAPTPENIWQNSQIIKAGEVLEPGVINREGGFGLMIIGRLKEVFQGDAAFGQETSFWYVCVDVNGSELAIVLGEPDWGVGVGYLPLNENHNAVIPFEDAGRIFTVEEVVNYLNGKERMPIMYELTSLWRELVEQSRNNSDCNDQCKRVIEMSDSLNIPGYIQRVMNAIPANDSYYSGELPNTLVGGEIYIPGFWTPVKYQ